jgi:hypothetical protein
VLFFTFNLAAFKFLIQGQLFCCCNTTTAIKSKTYTTLG